MRVKSALTLMFIYQWKCRDWRSTEMSYKFALLKSSIESQYRSWGSNLC